MIFDAWSAEEHEFSNRLWSFAHCHFDESSRELLVSGKAVELESKPLEVLYQLLVHAGAVVRKEELLESVWPGVTVVDGSLATAVSKLRKALGDDDPPIVLTIPRIGYRLGVPVNCKRLATPRLKQLDFKPGDGVPGRDQWQLVRQLGRSEANEVWLAEHRKTREARVFKFASDGVRLRALKREVTLSRFLNESLGDRADFVSVLEWNFEAIPFYLESEYCGANLAEWAESQGGLAKIPLETRLQVLIKVARAVAAAHEVGVLHKDLKPDNVLVAPGENDSWQIRVADFGSGWLLDPVRLSALGITNLGFTQSEIPQSDPLTGTLMYLAPEVLAGRPSSASADVYALGVMLYQLAASDFRKPLSPGWEADVEDPLLREDIADAACGNPARRLGGAAALAERLESLVQRRSARAEEELLRQRAKTAERRLAKARTRRPWLIASILTLAAGLAASLGLYRSASSERDRANHQTAIAAAVSQFLANDLMGRSDPFQSGNSGETLVDAVKKASPDIDRQFRGAPEVAARLHQTIARALDNRSDFPDARGEYDRAAALFEQAGAPSAEDAIVVQLQRASMEARSYEKGSLARARAMVGAQEVRIAGLSKPRVDMAVWLAWARGMIALIDNDAKQAVAQFRTAYDRAATLRGFDENALLTLKQRLAFAYIRLGDGAKAEQLFRDLIAAFSRIQGPQSPGALRVRLNLAQAFMIQGKHKEAIAETTSIYPAYMARLGEEHELAMQVLATRAQSEGSLGLWDDAIRDDLKIHELAARKQGAMSFFAVATLSDAALAQCRQGSYREGEPNARQAFEASSKAFGARAGLTGGAAYTLASCQIGLGNLREASSLLAQIDTQAVAQLAGIPDWSANVELAQADIAYRRGDQAAARRHIQAATPAFSRPDAEPYQKHALETLTAATRF